MSQKKKKRTLPIGPQGEVKLPLDAMEALDLEPGGTVEIVVDTRRKQIRLERHVDDPWADALREKDQKGFGDLLNEQDQRETDAADLFDRKIKEPPPKRKPEDDPDLWR